MKYILAIILFPIAVIIIYNVMFSVPDAVKKTKEVTNEHPQGCFAAAFIIGGIILAIILYFANA